MRICLLLCLPYLIPTLSAIRSRNRALLEAEGNDSEEDNRAPAPKRQRTGRNISLSDDEEEMAAGLESVRAAAQGHQGEEEVEPEEEDRAPHRAGEDEDLHADLDGIDVDDVDIEMDLGSGEGDLSNEVCLPSISITLANISLSQIGVEGSTEASSRKSRTRSATPQTPRPRTPRARNSNASNNSKVVEKDFTPRTLKLALSAKSHVRTRSVYDEPFPRNNKISRINFSWKTIKESAMTSEDPEVRQAYKRATKDTSLKSKLMKFVSYCAL